MLSPIYKTLKKAVERGYIIDPENQKIYSPTGKKLKFHKHRGGGQTRAYLGVHFNLGNGLQRTVKVHRAFSFVLFGKEPFKKGIVTRHINDKPRDNRPENLTYGTAKDNAKDAKRNSKRR